MLGNMYNTEFCESRLGFGIEASNNMEDISFDNLQYLKLMDEKSRKVGQHFEITLLMKDRSVKLPNNRNMTRRDLIVLSQDLSEAQNSLQITKDSLKIC